MPAPRGPMPEEVEYYLNAVKWRDEEMYRGVFDRFPLVLWGDVHNTLSEEDKQWITEVRRKDETEVWEDDWDGYYI